MNLTTLLGIPIDCSGRLVGVERMPAALRAAGLTARRTAAVGVFAPANNHPQ